MTVTIKPLAEHDFFAWYELFTISAESAGVTPDDERAMRVWTTLQEDQAHGVIATDETGAVVGLAHFVVFERLLQGDTGFLIEDLFVREESRGNGVATALIEHVRTRAEQEGRATVRWVARPNDPAATALFTKFADASGDWVLHDLSVG